MGRVCSSLKQQPGRLRAFLALVEGVRRRSDVLRTPADREGRYLQVEALRNLVAFRDRFVRAPDDWVGASGHPLSVDPVPRFLAAVWFGEDRRTERVRRKWFVEHAAGRPLRRLQMPFVMSRRMEDELVRTADHVPVNHALRQAEVRAVGGSAALAGEVVASRLGTSFAEPTFWRTVIEWLVQHRDVVPLAQVRPIIDYLQAVRHERLMVDTPTGTVRHDPPLPAFSLQGRTYRSVMRLVTAWHAGIGCGGSTFTWPAARWRGLVYEAEAEVGGHPGHRTQWSVVELTDRGQLAREGQSMHHCVGGYARACAAGRTSIWSVRRRSGTPAALACAGEGRSLLTIEVHSASSTIIQIRGVANAPARGFPLRLVQQWAARERLSLASHL